MHIENFRLRDHKSFLDSGSIDFKPGFNIVIGKNNSGKTALLESLRLQEFSHVAHKFAQQNASAPSEILFSLDYTDLKSFFHNEKEMFFPLADSNSGNTAAELRRLFESFQSNTRIRFVMKGNGLVYSSLEGFGSTHTNPDFILSSVESVGLTYYEATDTLKVTNGWSGDTRPEDIFTNELFSRIGSRNYFFSAQRLDVGSCQASSRQIHLEQNASNLPAVLHTLYTENPPKFRRYQDLVKQIFPEIKLITITRNNDKADIKLWYLDEVEERDDLAIHLDECGTGISQVMAMLYVLVTSKFPRVIFIDEPQSFLHPGAIRRLFDIFHDYQDREPGPHQYIITTHSTVVISAARPSNILLVRREGLESKVKTIDIGELHDARLAMSELGVRLSDVFGADNILWVEGPTEEACFPLILEKLGSERLRGTEVLHVDATSELEGKDYKRIIRIYERFSDGEALVPPAIAFAFDREDRNEQEVSELERRLKNKVHLLKRRMFENYLIHADAIAAVMNGLEDFRDEPITSHEVQALIDEWPEKIDVQADADDPYYWKRVIHAANLLKHLFRTLSDARYEYSKIDYGLALTQWLLDNNQTTELQEIADLLDEIFKKAREKINEE